ncbi:MAG: PEGA domain-containing protein [Myxococcota bacterium]
MMRWSAVACVLAALLVCPDAEARRRGRKGALALKCTVKGAKVTVNGRGVGKTPMKQIALSGGLHTVKVKKLGYLDFSQKIQIKPGKTVNVIADLLPFAGVIKVSANVSRAKVLVDGKVVGKAPLEREVKIGKHTITVRASGYEIFSEEITADPGNLYTIKAKLKRGGSSGAVSMDLALVALTAPGGADLALEPPPTGASSGSDDLALAPLPGLAPLGGGLGAGDDPLALEPLPGLAAPPAKEIAAINPAFVPPGGGSGIGATIEPPKPWYKEWWVWTAAAAGAVFVTGVVFAAVTVGRGGEETSNERTVDACVAFGTYYDPDCGVVYAIGF